MGGAHADIFRTSVPPGRYPPRPVTGSLENPKQRHPNPRRTLSLASIILDRQLVCVGEIVSIMFGDNLCGPAKKRQSHEREREERERDIKRPLTVVLRESSA